MLATRAKVVSLAGAGALAAFMIGFLAFAAMATRTPVHEHGAADGIVVLTGGGARLGEAGRLLRQGFARRLLISGVNPRTRREDLERLTGLDDAGFACCVDIGYAARDTVGNAGEARAWANAHRFRRLIVVTSAYHMPRSLAELAHAMPGVALSAHAVMPLTVDASAWWRDAGSLRVLAGEYVKFLSSAARLAVGGLGAAGDATDMAGTGDPRTMAVRQ